jgi:RimJ/RimL family protein N-acetyltransferase
VTLRPLTPADHDRLFAVAADPLIWEQHPDKTRSTPAGFDAFFREALDSGGALLATETGSGRVIGSSRFHGYDEAAGEVEIGWTFLARSHWGGRYNREMKALMLAHAFRSVDRVVFLIDPANHRSQQAVRKIGGDAAGTRTDAFGREVCVFQITAEAWRGHSDQRPVPAAPLPAVDHLVWGGPSLAPEIARIESLIGVRAVPGGHHPDEGTHNALIGLGPDLYLELIAPDPEQPAPGGPRWFGLDDLSQPRLLTWALKATYVDRTAEAARAAGLTLGEVRDARREGADGQVLAWRLTRPTLHPGDGLIPFLIDWGRGPHPARSAPGGARLVGLWAEHPDPPAIREQLRNLGAELPVVRGTAPALVAVLDTPKGRVELR